ncbi:MAG: lysophospholipid acyltransferase family protein, partial [Pseudonocardia sp.]
MTGPRPAPLSLPRTLLLMVRRRWRGSGFWFGLAIALLWAPTMLCNRITFRGGEHVPRTGGVLLACNHVSFCDPIFDVAFTICHGRMPRFLAKAELWKVPVVRDHRGDGAGGGGVVVTQDPIVRDHRTDPIVRDHRTDPIV